MQTENKALARSLRKEARTPEKKLWYCLRNRKVAGKKFRRQLPFGPYILDFYCAEEKLNIEIDGGQHDLPDHRQHDARRAEFLAREGIRTLRFWNSQIYQNLEGVLERIRMELNAPSPSP